MDVKADALHDVAFAVVGVHVPNAEECWCSRGLVGVFAEVGFYIHCSVSFP